VRTAGEAIAPTPISFSRTHRWSRVGSISAKLCCTQIGRRLVPGTKVLPAGDQWQWLPAAQARIIGSVGGRSVQGGAG
jgi:hypothetical protein